MCFRGESNLRPLAFPARRSYHWTIEPVDDLWLKTFSLIFSATINQHVWQCMYEIDFGEICIGTKGAGEGRQWRHVPPYFQKWRGRHKPTCVPTSRHRARPLTVRQNLHFFYQYRCYLLLFIELCMDKPQTNQHQFHTCIVPRVY